MNLWLIYNVCTLLAISMLSLYQVGFTPDNSKEQGNVTVDPNFAFIIVV